MNFSWDIIGHERQLKRMENDIETDNVSHAYLLSGPAKIGKWKIAKKFSMVLQCDKNGCNNCKDCKLIQLSRHPDTLFYKDEGKHIPISYVRSLQDILFRSRQSKYRIIIIENIERMLIPSQNAFLKILEEPPKGTIFILTTSNISDLLPTILSRVRTINFYPLGKSVLKSFLEENFSESSEKIENILSFSHGKIGFALDLIKDYDLFRERKIMIESIESLLKSKNGVSYFSYIHQICEDQNLITHYLESLLGVLRNFLLHKVKGDDVPLTFTKIVILIERTENLIKGLKANINKKLLFENLLLEVGEYENFE